MANSQRKDTKQAGPSLNNYQNLHEKKSSCKTDDVVVVDVDVVAAVGALVHVTNVAELDLKNARISLLQPFQECCTR